MKMKVVTQTVTMNTSSWARATGPSTWIVDCGPLRLKTWAGSNLQPARRARNEVASSHAPMRENRWLTKR